MRTYLFHRAYKDTGANPESGQVNASIKAIPVHCGGFPLARSLGLREVSGSKVIVGKRMAIDWSIVLATMAGPVLAVQAQKWIERASEKRRQRVEIFQDIIFGKGLFVDVHDPIRT